MFIAAPKFNEEVVKLAAARSIPVLAGCADAGEVKRARELAPKMSGLDCFFGERKVTVSMRSVGPLLAEVAKEPEKEANEAPSTGSKAGSKAGSTTSSKKGKEADEKKKGTAGKKKKSKGASASSKASLTSRASDGDGEE